MKELNNNLNIPIEILQQKITNVQKIVLATLYQLLKKEEELHISISRLAELSECSRSSASTALQLFKKNRWIVIHSKKDFDKYVIEIDNSYYMGRTLDLFELQEKENNRKINKSFNNLHMKYNILHNKLLSPTDKLVLAYNSNFTKNNKECFTKTDNICDMLHITNREYLKSMKKLKELNLLESEIIRKNNRIAGKKVKANLDNINNFYIENIDRIKQLEIDKATIKEVKNIEKLNSKETNIHNVEKLDNIEKVETINFVNIGRLSDELLETLTRDQLYKLYKENQKELERLKHFINKESEQ